MPKQFKEKESSFRRSFSMSFRRMASRRKNKISSPKPPKIPENPIRYLITGGAGNLAVQLVQKLEEMAREKLTEEVGPYLEWRYDKNHDVVTERDEQRKARHLEFNVRREVERLLPTRLQIVMVDKDLPHSNRVNNYICFVQCSFNEELPMKTALENVDVVFHIAAVGMTGFYARNRDACMKVNCTGTGDLLIWARNKGVRRFIYTSSVGVIFTGEPLINARESVVLRAQTFYNVYCESKAHAEEIVQNGTCDAMKTTVVRFSGIYGPGEKKVTERVANFMKTGWWIGICKPNGQEAQTQLSSVDNCIQGMIKAEEALRFNDARQGQIYHIVDREHVGTFSFWAPLNKALGFPDPMFVIPRFLLRVLAVVCQLVCDVMGVDPFISLLEIDLLTVTNTYSIDRACREIGYDPKPSPMPEIIEMYTKDMPERRQWWKKVLEVWQYGLAAVMVIVGLLLLFYLGIPLFWIFMRHFGLPVFWYPVNYFLSFFF